MKGRTTNQISVGGLLYFLRNLDKINRDFHIFLHFCRNINYCIGVDPPMGMFHGGIYSYRNMD